MSVETDKLLAEKLMGWPKLAIGQMEPIEGYWDRGSYIEVRRLRGDSHRWSPSTNFAHTHEVIEQALTYGVMIESVCRSREYQCSIQPQRRDGSVVLVSGIYGDPCTAACDALTMLIDWMNDRERNRDVKVEKRRRHRTPKRR